MVEPVLITGAAGFIGFHTTKRLLERGLSVVGIDNMDDYYDVELKKNRLAELQKYPSFTFRIISIQDRQEVSKIFSDFSFQEVIHLAGRAGIRAPPSDAPKYVDSNLVGFCNIIDLCSTNEVQHFVYASSSSVYGTEAIAPFSTSQSVDHPQSLYAATKRANELLAHAYSHNYSLPTTGLRFFTVYGPWGRPDMAVYKFTKKISRGEEIVVYGRGEVKRDFTYVDDVVDAIIGILSLPPRPVHDRLLTPAVSKAPYQIFNVGNGEPVTVNGLVANIELALNAKAKIRYEPTPSTDLNITHAHTEDLESALGFASSTDLEEGIRRFVTWFQSYYEDPKRINRK